MYRAPHCVVSLLLFAAVGVAGASSGASELPDRVVRAELVHAEANTGTSAGGHVALRIGDDVYEYQYVAARDLLLLERRPWHEFHTRYAELENRTLQRLAFTPMEPGARALAGELDRALIAQGRQLDRLDARALELRVLRALEAGRNRVEVPYGRWVAGPPESDAGRALRAAFDPNELAAERARTEALLHATVLRVRGGSAEAGAHGLGGSGSAETLRDGLWRLLALQALEQSRGVGPDVLRAAVGPPLSPEERGVQGVVGREQAARIRRLLRSPRPDAGRAMLIAIARHHAAWHSNATGVLHVVDVLEPDAPRVTPGQAHRSRRPLGALDTRFAALERDARARLGRGATGDVALRQLEGAVSHARELRAYLEGGRPPRLAAGAGPRGTQPGLARLPVVQATPEGLAAARARAGALHDEAEAALEDGRRYALFSRNCATALRGRLPGEASVFDFAPFALAARVSGDADAVARDASQREVRLAAMRAREGALRVGLREANTITGRIHRDTLQEDAFLFYTDDVAWPLRPLLGLANVGAGLVGTLAGVVAVPFDRGFLVHAGLRGIFYSAPELVGVNLRKGRFVLSGELDAGDELLSSRPASGPGTARP